MVWVSPAPCEGMLVVLALAQQQSSVADDGITAAEREVGRWRRKRREEGAGACSEHHAASRRYMKMYEGGCEGAAGERRSRRGPTS